MRPIFLVFCLILCCFSAFSQISQNELDQIAAAFHTEYDKELAQQNAKIFINPDPNPQMIGFWMKSDYVRASYGGYFDSDSKMFLHYLFILGGYARLPGMSRDFYIATLCHELGHGIGGPPYKDFGKEKISVEGQSDYFAFRWCLPRLFKRIPPNQKVIPLNSFTDSLCRSLPVSSYLYCTRAFQTLESERRFLKLIDKDSNTDYHTPDKTVVKEVETIPEHYPSSQCRLDTMIQGILGKNRPACWFPTSLR